MIYNKNENHCTMWPDELFGVNYNHGCFFHDRQYRNEVENRKKRKQADKDLRKFVINKFRKNNMFLIGFINGWLMYFGTRMSVHIWRVLYDLKLLPKNKGRELWV